MTHSTNSDEYFRCALPVENGSAQIRIGRRSLEAQVQEASIDGFTVLVQPSNAAKLSLGRPWILVHDESTLEVHAQWFFHAEDGNVQIGLRRLRDLTRPPMIGGWMPSFVSRHRGVEASGGSLMFVSAVLLAVLSLALPGIGDVLGTSGRIQQGIASLAGGIRSFMP
ncbi:hypothetical protein [Neorhodopirellula lusitana]|uniref:hypothetical protein n=1 Tax=Neorhodopirellula lusitana TaxID=445327 RepID=UPI00384E2D6E